MELLPTIKPAPVIVFAILSSICIPKEQEEGYSIEAQKHRLHDYCKRKKLQVLKVFEIVESSTRGDRSKFMEMVAFARRYKEPIAIVADKVDRVQRSFREFPVLDDLIHRGSIELHFNTENYLIHKDSRSTDRTMWSMSVLMAQSYADAMSDNIKRSIEHKIRNGEWNGPAPLGYLNQNVDGKSDIVIDPSRAELVRRVFEEYATGAYTLTEIAKKAKDWGLRSKKGYPLNKAVLHRFIQREFYYGEMEIKGVLHPHRYPPLITRELFKACEDVRLGYNKKPFRYRGKDFIFRGILTCATTGKLVTADTKKKTYANGNKAEWTYLRCTNPDDTSKIMWVREDSVIKQVADVFNHLGIKNPEMLQNVVDYIKETNRNKKAFHNQEVGQLKKQHTENQSKLDRLMDLRLEGEITKEEFESKKSQIKDKQYELDSLILTYDKADDQFTKTLCALLTIASDSDKIWMGSTISEKRELLNFVFANLQLKGATLCYTLRKPFDNMLNQADCIKWRE
jgi:DNA invertase Pin-like site-specific DNA recombinase